MATKKIAQKDVIILAVGMLVVGWILGNLYANTYGELDSALNESTSEEHSEMNESAMVHAHETVELNPETDSIPTVKLLAEQDKKSGWNLTLLSSNFSFAPQSVNENDVLGEGHAHLWVDGEKITRLYGNNYYLGTLEDGDHEITVTLNANSHKDYTVNGEVIESSVVVTETRGGSSDVDHSH